MKVRLLCAIVALGSVGSGFAADPGKSLKFWWKAEKRTAVGAALQANEFQEQMTWSKSATPAQPYQLNQTTAHATYRVEPMCVTNVPVHFATARRTVNQDCLYLVEPMFEMANGGKAIDRQSVFLPPEVSMLGKEGTLFVRFMWLGRHFSENTTVNFIGMGAAWGSYGWTLGFGGHASLTSAYVRFRNYKAKADTYERDANNQNTAVGLLKTNEWIELAISFKPIIVDGVEKTQVSMYKQRPVDNVDKRMDLDTWTLQSEALVLPPNGNTYNRCQISNADGSGIREGVTTSASFRGLVHEIKMFDRALDADEVRQVMAGENPEWKVGAENASADEFSNDSDVQDVFVPDTMPWRKFRKTLTSDHPSVSVKCEIAEEGHELARLLQMRFLPNAQMPGTRVRIDVNGVKVGEKRITAEGGYKTVFLSDAVMSSLVKDLTTGKYPLTVTFTRTDNLDGDLSFDWLSLGGSWQIGYNDDNNTEFGSNGKNENYHYNLATRDYSKMTKAFGGFWGSTVKSQTADVSFSMTANEVALYEHRLYVRGSSYATYDLYLNGLTEDCLLKVVNGDASRWGYTVSLPVGKLADGLNTLYFKGTGNSWAGIDYLKMTVINNGSKNRDPRGTCLTIK